MHYLVPDNIAVAEIPLWLIEVIKKEFIDKGFRVEKVFCLEWSDIEIFYIEAHQYDNYNPSRFIIERNTNYDNWINIMEAKNRE